ncbi:flagellar hook-basal body complex protein FliE [Anaerovibrio sp.]|uniref:flagellar hook-basal body complex protein FliE n=1 Tax=Anaerovibrio sp. TaxID=1872532 RepID=UPI001B6D9BAC|nr:flagellar hook-basal body complex protein FliE [Anaerovibrio sp.]MBP3230927.1 flagellar hook-basal body complex protein FliE [Anaerovibrio sp.]MBR2142930.1 flagellar hook-basal body complex protein FliE [Anaerovibrio sp.]
MQMEPLQMTPVSMHAESHLGETKEQPVVKSFGEYLGDALGKVNALEKEAERMDAALAAGQVEDISQVIVAGEKADIAMQVTLQVRNRVVEAYQEIMRMQV